MTSVMVLSKIYHERFT